MKKTFPIIAVLIAGLAYAAIYGTMYPAPLANESAPMATSTTAPREQASSSSPANIPATATATLKIASSTYRVAITDNETVADMMESLRASDHSFTYTADTYPGMGIMVQSINGSKGSNGKYWILYVNGTSAALGASSIHLHPGDSVEWRLEKSN